MNKRGLSYIDWVISMGLFLVIVLSLFIFLKPGVQPVFDNPTLLSLAENAFFSNVSWTVKQTPVIIYKLTDEYPGEQSMQNAYIQLRHPLPPSVNWTFSGILPDPYKHAALDFTIAGLGSEAQFDCTDAVCKTENFDHLYVVSHDPVAPDIYEVSLECIPENEEYCHAEFGATEDLEGLSPGNLLLLAGTSYDDVKKLWNYPKAKEMNITLLYHDGQGAMQLVAPDMPVPLQANVFVQERASWVISKEGERVPVKILFAVW